MFFMDIPLGRWFIITIIFMAPFSVAAQDDAVELNYMYQNIDTDGATQETPVWRGFVGGSVRVVKTAIGKNIISLGPRAAVSYRDTVYWQVTHGGVWLVKSDDRRARAGLAVKLRGGYDPDNAARLAGMEERDTSLEAGIKALWVSRPLTASVAYYTDVSDTSNGDSASVNLSYQFLATDHLSIAPSLGAEWQSTEVIGYYYGVRPNEVTAGRPAYAGKSTINLHVSITAHYRWTPHWSFFGGGSYTRLGTGMTDSPVVIRNGVPALYAGINWRF